MNDVIPAILVLQDGKTFGKVKNKYYYKCIPHSKEYSSGLVLYNIKQIGWNKHNKNKYVLLKTTDTIQNKRIVYSIIDSIGDVDDLTNFYTYSLHCRGVWFNDMKDINNTVKKMKYHEQDLINSTTDKCKEDRTDRYIISIDPKGSLDIDDAVGIREIDGQTILSIYIANVPMYIEALNEMSCSDISVWKMLSKQVSTIYLPNGKRAMIPKLLSDDFCSLLEGKDRFALVCDIVVKEDSYVNVSFTNCKIRVKKNYDYEDKTLEANQIYNKVKSVVEKLNLNYAKYFDSNTEFDSHTIIEYLMLFMNNHAAKYLYESSLSSLIGGENISIYRTLSSNNKSTPNSLPNNVQQFIRGWNSNGGGKYSTTSSPHDFLNLNVYTHITSPIRRMIDLLNSIEIQKRLGLFSFTKEAIDFYEEHVKEDSIIEVNRQMKDIRKCQTECNLLSVCVNDKSVLGKEYQGYICDKTILENGKTSYLVYIKELNMVCNYKCSDMNS